MAAYHVDLIGFESPVVCKFVHTRCQAITGYLRAIYSSKLRYSLWPLLTALRRDDFKTFLWFLVGLVGGYMPCPRRSEGCRLSQLEGRVH